jgi:hypothetical protein
MSLEKNQRLQNFNLRQENGCSEGCIECIPRGVCVRCSEGFTTYNGKCFDNNKVNSFIRDLSENMEDKQKEIMAFLINKAPGEQNDKSMYIDINQGRIKN